jgi:hypothetical protein
MKFNWNMNLRKFIFNPLSIGIRKEILHKQNSIYFNLNLDRNLALSKLNKVLLDNFSKEYDEDNGMWPDQLFSGHPKHLWMYFMDRY